jgi:hypothetical protein
MVLLQQGEKRGIVVPIPIIKGEENGLLDLIYMLQILKPDGGVAAFQQKAKLPLQLSRRDKKLRRAPGIIADPVVHQHRDLISLRRDPISGGRGTPELAGVLVRVNRDVVTFAKVLHAEHFLPGERKRANVHGGLFPGPESLVQSVHKGSRRGKMLPGGKIGKAGAGEKRAVNIDRDFPQTLDRSEGGKGILRSSGADPSV